LVVSYARLSPTQTSAFVDCNTDAILVLYHFALSQILNGTTAIVVKVLKIKEPPSVHMVHSEEELKMLVSASHEEGLLESGEEEMLHSVFDFSDTTASEVMTPRIDLVWVSAETTMKAFVAEALKHGHSRLPVYDEDEDHIFGWYIRDGLRSHGS
jgi:CBS domain containing-hemolysin-like protein